MAAIVGSRLASLFRLRPARLGALLALLALVAPPGAAAAPVPRPHVGALPGFPRLRGVMPVLGSAAAAETHTRLERAAPAARARHTAGGAARAKTVAGAEPECPPAFDETFDVCYQGGPVLRGASIHLIFWQGKVKGTGTEASVEAFPAGYEAALERYFADLAHDSGLATDVFAVDPQYYSEAGGVRTPGEYRLRFKTEAEAQAEEEATHVPVARMVYRDTEPFPKRTASECKGASVTAEGKGQAKTGPCLLDEDLHAEIGKAAAASGWSPETFQAGSTEENIFIVLTPPGVGGCFEEASPECAYSSYCAYHSDFGGSGAAPEGQTVYADIPYVGGVAGCEIFAAHPTKVQGADPAIDAASHELNETITDPLGSQCNEEGGRIVGCESYSWLDALGQEIDDKCLPPETTLTGVQGIYGEPLGDLTPELEEGLYNQGIDGDHYWTQRAWSDAAAPGGACVQRMLPVTFPPPTDALATVPATFDGAAAGEPADPAVYWVWSFGDGVQVGTPEASVAHTYAQSGTYPVTLTAYDAYGNSDTATLPVVVAPAPPAPTPPPPTPAPPVQTVTVKESAPAPTHLTAAQVAAELGLPAGGATLPGLGTVTLGHGTCPPACGVTVSLYASVATTVHGHRRRVKRERIGALHTTIAPGGTGGLSLTFDAAGRALLRHFHRLRATLVVAVEGREGAVWRIARAVTLTASASAGRNGDSVRRTVSPGFGHGHR